MSSETQISSTPPINSKIWNNVEFYKFIISFHVFLNSLLMPVITYLIAGYTLAVSLCIIYTVRHFASFLSPQLHKTWQCLCNSTILQQHSVGTCGRGLSLYRALSVTGHQSSANGLQQQCNTQKSHKQYEIPTIPDFVISKLLLPQSKINADFVHSNCSLI